MQQFFCSFCWCRLASFLCKSKEIFSWRCLQSATNFVSLFLACVVCPLSSCLQLTLLLEILKIFFVLGTCAPGNFGQNLWRYVLYDSYLPHISHRNTRSCNGIPNAAEEWRTFQWYTCQLLLQVGCSGSLMHPRSVEQGSRQLMNEWQHGSEKLRTLYESTW